MAFAGSPTSSPQYAAQADVNRSGEPQGEVHLARFSYTHTAGNGTGEINLVKLPAGRLVIYASLSRVIGLVNGVNSDLHLGYRAHRTEAGVPVAQSHNAFLDDFSAGGDSFDNAFELPSNHVLELESQEGIVIFATVDTGNIQNGNTISGYVAYTRG